MAWNIGFDSNTQRDIGYGVPAVCDHPGCKKPIDRGLGYMCGGSKEGGCGLFFCGEHRRLTGLCECCTKRSLGLSNRLSFKPKADVAEWLNHKLTHASWAKWRKENKDATARIRQQVARRKGGVDARV